MTHKIATNKPQVTLNVEGKSEHIRDNINIDVIGVIKSPFKQKFAVPRQAGLSPSSKSTIEFYPPFSDPNAFIGLDGFSHIHILFLFDLAPYNEFKPTVRPPRLGGNKHVGVFATRSPFRPSRIGLSVVRLDAIEIKKGRAILHVSGADIVDGTPIIDIKPYIPFVDIKNEAKGGYANEKPPLKDVIIAKDVDTSFLYDFEIDTIKEVLGQDPRPAYKGSDDKKEYQALVCDCDIRFFVYETLVSVHKITRIKDGK